VYVNEEQMEVVFEECEEWKRMSLADVVDVVFAFQDRGCDYRHSIRKC
jgi:hypothetical protein